MAWFAVAMVLVVVAITQQLLTVQVADPERYLEYGASQRSASRDLPASRGSIYDRNGQALALTVAEPRLIVDPSQVRKPITTARTLAAILDADAAELEAGLRADGRYEILAEQLTEAEVAEIQALMDDAELPGLSFEDEYVRRLPSDELAQGVLGRALPEGVVDASGTSGGISGIESAYEEQLAGTPGELFYEKDAFGNPIAGGDRNLVAAQQGTDLYLTLDQSLQYEAEQALTAQVTAMGAKSAMAVIMRPSTGEILSMASVAADEDGEVSTTRDNRPVTAVFEPGSTNKMITVAAALEEGVVAPDTIMEVPDHLQVADKEFTDAHPHPAAAWSPTDILVTSSNVGTIKIAQQLGSAKVDEYLRSFGFGDDTHLGFPAEEDGLMKPVEEWYSTDIGAIPIGQGIAVTGLQMLAAYNVIANDGVYVEPKLVASTDPGSGQVPTEPSGTRRVISEANAKAMQAILAQVVTDGTGKKAAVPGYESAGKTGTAYIAQQGGDDEDGYLNADGRRRYWSSFVGMVNGADLSILVAVEDPRTAYYGSDVAAPVFSHLAVTALRRFQIPPPGLVDPAEHGVLPLSDSARGVEGEDVTGDAAAAAE